jgi:3-oxoacyl-[acyl-carrier protein] reductase
MTGRLSGETAVVTGAGNGIGRAIAMRLARDGARVLAVDINGGALDETIAIARTAGLALSHIVADVADDDAPERICSAADREIGGVSLLLNNAGMGQAQFDSLHDAETTLDAEFDRILSVNLRSLFRMSRAVIQRMKPKKRGVIVNIASIYGLTGAGRTTAYSTAKAGVVGLTHQSAADCGPLGIRVNAIAPGFIETNMIQQALREREFFRSLSVDMVPLGRVGQPEDIASAAAFLCSEDASYVHGHVLVVDGGWLNTRWREMPQT